MAYRRAKSPSSSSEAFPPRPLGRASLLPQVVLAPRVSIVDCGRTTRVAPCVANGDLPWPQASPHGTCSTVSCDDEGSPSTPGVPRQSCSDFYSPIQGVVPGFDEELQVMPDHVSGSDDPGRYPLSHHPVITRDDPPGSLYFGVMTGWVTQVGQVMRTVLYAEI